jgi:outer membrane scaffolding protein for murein synthesis (MipA/OmpV family)
MSFKYTSKVLAFGAIILGASICTFAILLTLTGLASAAPTKLDAGGIAQQPNLPVPDVSQIPNNQGSSDENRDPWLGGDFELGILGGGATSIYRDGKNARAFVLPVISYDAERLHIGLDELRVTAWKNDKFSISAIGSLRTKPFEAGDGPYLAGMKDRDTAFEAGLSFTAMTGPGEIQVSSLFDVSSVHHGQQVDVSYQQSTEIGAVNVAWGGGLTWQSEDLTDYMVGVRRNEVRSDRKFYAPDAAFIPHLDVVVSYPLYERVTLVGNAGVQYLPAAYHDSPIVDKDYLVSFAVGALYAF